VAVKHPVHLAFVVSLAAAAAGVVPLAGAAAPDAAGTIMQPKRIAARAPVAEPRVDKLIVQLRDPRAALQSLAPGDTRVRAMTQRAGAPLRPVRVGGGGAHVLQLDRALPLSEARALAARLARDPAVEYAEPNVRFRALMLPSEPRFEDWQWNYFAPNADYTGSIGASSITTRAAGGANLPPAWDVTTGTGSVTVAVIDTGIVNHEDLNGVANGLRYVPAGRFLPGYDFVSSDNGVLPPSFVANDGDGRDNDPSDPGDWITAAEKQQYPSDCAIGETPPFRASDSSWHGTHMTGLVAATANNGRGIAGAAWNVSILPVRALGKCGGDLSDIADAVRWAAGLSVPGAPPNLFPAQVISLSLGGGDTCSRTMQDAVNAANGVGAVVVAATGNDGTVGLISPANCEGVVAVTAHAINGENAVYANIGAGTSISAPGGGSPDTLGLGGVIDNPDWDGYYIYSTVLFGATGPLSSDGSGQRGSAYAGFVGTSTATPQAAGVAALLKSIQPTAASHFVRAWLTMADRVRPHPAGGACNLQVRECGRGLLDAALAVRGALEAVPAVSVSAAARSAPPAGTIRFTGSAEAFASRTLASVAWSATGGTLSAAAGPETTLTLPPNGYVEVSLTATDSAGRVARDAIVVRVNRAPVAEPPGPQSASVGQTLTFRVGASDGDGDALFLQQDAASTVPDGTLGSDGTFRWNTGSATPGTYRLVYTATDGMATSSPAGVTITLTAGSGGGSAGGGGGGTPGGGSSAVPPSGGGGGGALALALVPLLALARRLRERQ
jgi:serine protease